MSATGLYVIKSCDGGLKCPFGEYWACPKVEEKAILGQCTGYAKNCKVGDILNSDGTCTTDKETGKEPLGVVIVIKDSCGWAMTASPIQKGILWSSNNTITGIGTTIDWTVAIKDFDACANTQKIIQLGNSSQYPAAWAVVNYTPNTVPTTKGKWCLPAPGMLNSLYTNLNAVNNTISKLGGAQLTNDNEHIWSSSEWDKQNAWYFRTLGNANSGGIWGGSKANGMTIRPVLAF